MLPNEKGKEADFGRQIFYPGKEKGSEDERHFLNIVQSLCIAHRHAFRDELDFRLSIRDLELGFTVVKRQDCSGNRNFVQQK
jgi:hypothetical protein